MVLLDRQKIAIVNIGDWFGRRSDGMLTPPQRANFGPKLLVT
jgi:hypothetical protein